MENTRHVIWNHASTPPVVYGDLSLIFEDDFPVEPLDAAIGLPAHDAKRRKDTHLNPLTKQHNVGYWTYRTEPIVCADFDCAPLFARLADILRNYSGRFQQVMQQHAGSTLLVCIYADIRERHEYPAMRIPPELLCLLSALNASMDVIITDCYEDDAEDRIGCFA